jgi:hypothetical protein
MGDEHTTRRGDARQARLTRAARAAGLGVPAMRDCVVGSDASRSRPMRATVGASPFALPGFPTIRCERPLAFGALRLRGALG